MWRSNLIATIENELKFEYVGGAIRYIDEHYDGAWTKAIDRFDAILGQSDEQVSRLEGEIYTATILRLIACYKESLRGQQVDKFLDDL